MSERPMANRASFQFKLFVIFTSLSLFTSCVFISIHLFDKVAETQRHAREEVTLIARRLAVSIRLPLYAEDRQLLEEVAGNAAVAPGITRVAVFALDGRKLAEVRPTGVSPVEPIGETVEVLTLATGVPGLADGQGGARLRIGSVRVERGTEDLRQAIRRDLGYSCLIALLFWLAVSGLSYLVLRRMTRSFEALVGGVLAMKEGDYDSRIPVVDADEAGRVAVAINGLAETLKRRDQENRELTRELVGALETQMQAREELAAANEQLARENEERVQAEKAARKSEQTLTTLMDIMPVGVLLTRADGVVEYVNQFLVDSFGYGREEIPTLDAWFSLVFPDVDYRKAKLAAQRDAIASSRSAEGGDAKAFDARLTCKAGNVRRVLLSNQAQGERHIVVAVDITDRELIQEQLNKVQKLESLGILAGGIAHNFNNALTGVIGFISITRCKLDAEHEAHAFLKLAEKASLRAAEMARQLLTFANGGAPVKKSVSLRKLVDEVVALTYNASNVRCEVQLPATLPAVRGDDGQLVQAFSNIVINAMQAMPAGGLIVIRAQAPPCCCQDPGHREGGPYVTLSIADQGHGIPPEHLPKIFDPYFSTKETTGLGLASVHSIVYRHGGHISVTSQVGQGTTFTICLPATKELPTGVEAADGAALKRRPGGRVLVMDDDPTVRELSGKMLGFLGYGAVACADGREAVDLYLESREAGLPFMAAILDLTVPGGMGGVEAAKRILAVDPQANLIVSSGYSNDPVLSRHRTYGFCGAVAKPYKADELSQELALLG